MHLFQLHRWQHSHTFGQDRRRPGEARTLAVVALTVAMMLIEIAAGLLLGSMALLADGLHMASHAAALGIALFAYVYARRHAADRRFSFGVGKVNALGGFSSALLLAAFALLMAWESVQRMFHPVAIAYDRAVAVALVGLVVNAASALILGGAHDPEHAPAPAHEHAGGHSHGGDHNLRAAYAHVLADALTSLLAIVALLAAKYLGWVWMDPLMGLVGAGLVARWALHLLHGAGAVLLDRQAPAPLCERIRRSIEQHDDNRVADLHLWSIGPDLYALILTVVTHEPKPAAYYRALIPPIGGLAHVTVEVIGEDLEPEPAQAAGAGSGEPGASRRPLAPS